MTKTLVAAIVSLLAFSCTPCPAQCGSPAFGLLVEVGQTHCSTGSSGAFTASTISDEPCFLRKLVNLRPFSHAASRSSGCSSFQTCDGFPSATPTCGLTVSAGSVAQSCGPLQRGVLSRGFLWQGLRPSCFQQNSCY